MLVLDREWAVVPRVSGRVVYVATTDTFASVDDGGGDPIHVPLAVVLAVRRPHFSEPLDVAAIPEPDTSSAQLRLDF